MSNFYFKRSCAIIIAVVFSFVFICTPCEGDENQHQSASKGSSPTSVDGYYPTGSITPKQDYTLIIVLGVESQLRRPLFEACAEVPKTAPVFRVVLP